MGKLCFLFKIGFYIHKSISALRIVIGVRESATDKFFTVSPIDTGDFIFWN